MHEQSDSDLGPAYQAVIERRMLQYTAAALERSVEVDEAIVIHTDFSAGLAAMDRVFQLGTALATPFGVRIVGPQGAGKTSLIRYFCASLPRGSLFNPRTDIVRLRLRQRPSLRHVVESTLTSLQYPFPNVRTESVGPKRGASIDALKQKRTRLVVVDEAHHLCARVTEWPDGSDEGSEVSEYLREIMDARVGLALMGGHSLEQLGKRDKYLESRCKSICYLTDFEFNGAWIALLKGIRDQVKTHNLALVLTGDQPFRMHRATAGNLRSLKQLLIEAVLVSTDRGSRELDVNDLRVAFDRALKGGVAAINPWVA